MTKLVSNLLTDISKARDLIARGDVREINNKMVIFDRVSRAVKTQLCIANEHENYSATTNMKNIKERTLRILLKTKKYLKYTYSHKGCHNGFVRKVRTLFEEG